jgi:enterochelin esterase-like enzyme
MSNVSAIHIENKHIKSLHLAREVRYDVYHSHPGTDFSKTGLLLINDGQNLEEMGFAAMLESLAGSGLVSSFLCVGIHASEQRKMEYGVASQPDYAGRGAKAGVYTAFILNELLPLLETGYTEYRIVERAFAGFSLGGLSAMDITWNHPELFQTTGVFSGSFWWRSLDQNEQNYDDDRHRIMHQLIRRDRYKPGLGFFFQCGNKDETRDRNHNGIIDSIDDTQDIIRELVEKGYTPGKDIIYLEMADGSHDIPTWGKAMPVFLEWLSQRKEK